MLKVVFVGAGSTVFVKNILGDLFLHPDIPSDYRIALYDIDPTRLEESRIVADALNARYNDGRATVSVHNGVEQRRDALAGADVVINAIQVGGYRPATVADFEIPKRYGLRQTIGDTLGIGGIFRGLRTIPVMTAIAEEVAAVAPGALLLNYTNPMAIVTGATVDYREFDTVGLCHSVQVCVPDLLAELEITAQQPRWTIAGINHMAWLLDVRDGQTDIYPEIKRRAADKNRLAGEDPSLRHDNMVRYELLRYFGHYVTESSEHNAEYTPFWIKARYPELIERFNIPLDEYPRRCERQIREWAEQKARVLGGDSLDHERSVEYAADIVAARLTDTPTRIHGNVRNRGLIDNLPAEAIVEVPIMVDGNGLNPVRVGALPTQCAALNQTNINVQLLTLEAAELRSKDRVYQAALLEPHTAAELPPDRIVALCDELFEAHQQWLPTYR